MRDDLHPALAAFVMLVALVTSVWATWCTWIAFFGGTMPLLGIETGGSFGGGMLFLLFAEPVLITLGYWASMLVVVPISLLLGRD